MVHAEFSQLKNFDEIILNTIIIIKKIQIITDSDMVTVLLLGSLLLQVRSIICDPTWSKSDPSWRPVSIFESVILNFLMQLIN